MKMHRGTGGVKGSGVKTHPLLIILVLVKFVLQHISSSLFGLPVIFTLIVFLCLRSRFIHSWMRDSLSAAAIVTFLIDVRHSQGTEALTILLFGLGFLFLFYLIMRRFLGFLFR